MVQFLKAGKLKAIASASMERLPYAPQYLEWLTQQSVVWADLIRKANVQVE